ncbi:Ion transport protein-domain-containing protein [Neocallimastix sp. 'constans']
MNKSEPILRKGAPENVFHDLSSRSTLFRTKLIDEFQLLDNVNNNLNIQAPVYTSNDLLDPKFLKKILIDHPNHLIKFQPFKRIQQNSKNSKIDRRLTRIKNIKYIPLGAWANWLINTSVFQNFIILVIIINVIMIGITTELQFKEDQYANLFKIAGIIDLVSMVIFITEIIVKWIDSFTNYWKDGWNISDFAVTIVSAIPEIMGFFIEGSSNGIGSVLKKLKILRVLRIFKIVVRFRSLKIIVLTILDAFQSLVFIMILIMLVMYILAILGMSLFENYTKSSQNDLRFHDRFGSLGESFKTLFQLLTFDQWNDMVKEISTISNPAVTTTYILIWTCLGAFIFRNVFVGVMVNNFDKINDEMNEQRADLIKTKRFEHMRKKLNEELRIQGNINTSIDNLKRTVDDKKYYDKLEVENKRNQLGLNDSLLSYKVKKDNNSINFSNNLNEFDSKYNNSNISTQKLSSIKEEEDIKDSDIIETIQRLLIVSNKISQGWENTISNTLNGLLSKQKETIWPRDTLFKYLQIMENLQENMKEYQELQLIAGMILIIIFYDYC